MFHTNETMLSKFATMKRPMLNKDLTHRIVSRRINEKMVSLQYNITLLRLKKGNCQFNLTQLLPFTPSFSAFPVLLEIQDSLKLPMLQRKDFLP